jgi:uncharacterized protein (DUF3084 family)
MSIVPKKYHPFISPPLRRVFPGNDAGDSSRAMIEKLKGQITTLQGRVGALKRDKALLIDRCESANSALARLTEDEHAARMARDQAKDDMECVIQNIQKLKADYKALRSR